MKVFKFGGASVKDAASVQNVARVIKQHQQGQPLLVVVSAMGKMTNAFEDLWRKRLDNDDTQSALTAIKSYHQRIIEGLYETDNEMFGTCKKLFLNLESVLGQKFHNKHQQYDAIVSFGELLSSTILVEYLDKVLGKANFLDARKYIITDESWREGRVDWGLSERLIRAELPRMLGEAVVVTQGFLAGTIHNGTTTLGREGSDFSAAIFATCLEADSVTIWKDVPGILNADPKRHDSTQLFEKLSYRQAAEMTYYGATVIHPKTIRPIANKKIPLYVRSFVNDEDAGTCISDIQNENRIESVIFKGNQMLISFTMKDLSNMSRYHMERIIKYLNSMDIDINFITMSAVSLAILVNDIEDNLINMEEIFEGNYQVSLDRKLELVTILYPVIGKSYDWQKQVIMSSLSADRHQYILSHD